MIVTGMLLIEGSGPDEPTLRPAPGWVRVAGTRLEEVQIGRLHPSPDLGGEHALISPGFIDAHVHLPQADSVGASGLTLLDWLERVVFPAEARWAHAGFAGEMSRRVIGSLIRSGTTGACAYATVHHQGARAALHAMHEAGLCARVGQVLMDQHAPALLTAPAGDLLDQAARLDDEARALGDGARVGTVVTPRFAVSCSGELLAGAGRLAAERGLPVQTHLAETLDECRLVERLHGDSYVEVYARAGLLRPGALMAHAIHLEDGERRRLAERGVVTAHCPTANLFLRSGAMDLQAVRRAQGPVVLGSDLAGGPDRCMVRVARAMIETAWRLGHEAPSPGEAWRMITAGAASALAFASTGRLGPGLDADVVVIEPDLPWLGAPDPLGAVLFGFDERWIRAVLVRGRVAHRSAADGDGNDGQT